jgi:hypothetical protein
MANTFDECSTTVMDGMNQMANTSKHRSKTEAICGNQAPEELTGETKILGVPMKEWNKAFVGNFEKTLEELKQSAERSSAINEKK